MRKKASSGPIWGPSSHTAKSNKTMETIRNKGLGKTKATPQLTHPRWCDHLPRVSPGEGCRGSLGGISLQH